MRAKILTLRFSPTLGRFDDAALVSLQQKVVLEQVREHLVQIGSEPMLVCVAAWREQPQATVASPAAAAPTEASPAGEPAVAAPAGVAPAASGPARPVGELRADLDDEQRQRFDALRGWRSRTAHAEGAPPYVILTNRQLVELVRARPDSKAGVGRIPGLGAKKVARYGDAILQLLWGARPQDAPAETQSAAATEGAA
ncbi:MAG: HRDC domain-containing protein [Planctomycetes bacterium]|nr:HRDC domain-containing protein [Planctomycetota bacterium]